MGLGDVEASGPEAACQEPRFRKRSGEVASQELMGRYDDLGPGKSRQLMVVKKMMG